MLKVEDAKVGMKVKFLYVRATNVYRFGKIIEINKNTFEYPFVVEGDNGYIEHFNSDEVEEVIEDIKINITLDEKELFYLAHTLWAAAQLSPTDGIEDGANRIVEILRKVSKIILDK